jgi:hypothetical protein
MENSILIDAVGLLVVLVVFIATIIGGGRGRQ